MTSTEIRTASNEVLRDITWGLIREASDKMSKLIAYGEMERRGLIKRRF